MYIVQGESAIEHVHCAMCTVQFGEWKLQCILLRWNIIQCAVQCSEAPLREGKQCFEQTLCLQNTCPHSPTPSRREGKSERKTFSGGNEVATHLLVD